MKFYLAGKYDRRLELSVIADILKAQGHEVQAEWLDGSHVATSHEEKLKYANVDFADIDACSHLVMFNLPVYDPEMSPGRHVELGYALAKGKHCSVVGAGDSVFYAKTLRFQTVEDFLEATNALSVPAWK